MKNLKKVLSLVLALAMALSLMTAAFAADAKDYADYGEVNYNEAVDVMTAIGVFDGMGGEFNPDGTLTREQAAKIITYMIMGKAEADKLVTTVAPYADVAANRWSAGAIAWCTNEGIISGMGNNRFAPTDNVTGLQFAKMLLVALGYDAEIQKLTGDSWAINTATLAINADLDKDMEEVSLSADLTREQACQMAFNTMKADTVEYDSRTSIDINGAQVTIGNNKAYAVTTTRPWGDNIYDEKADGVTQVYTVQFAEQYCRDLTLNGNKSNDDYGRPAHTWKYDNTAVGTYADEAVLTYNTAIKGITLADDLDDAGVEAYNSEAADSDAIAFKVYINGEDCTSWGTYFGTALANVGDVKAVLNSSADLSFTGNSFNIEIYEDDNGYVSRIVVLTPYLAKINSITADKASTTTVDERALNVSFNILPSGTKTITIDSDVTGFDSVYGNVEKGDYVLVTPNKGNTSSITGALDVALPEVVTGPITYVKDNEKLTMNGTSYEASAIYDALGANFGLTSKDATLLLDANGFVVGYEGPSAGDDKSVAVLNAYKTLNDDGELVDMIKGVTSDGETVTWQTDTDYTARENKVSLYTETDNEYTLTSGVDSALPTADGDVKVVYRTLSNAISTGSLSVNLNGSTEKAYFADDVKFIFVDDGKAVVKDGVQKVASGTTVYAVVEQDSNVDYITTLYVLGTAAASTTTSDELVFVNGTQKGSVQVTVDGKDKTFKVYDAYVNGEKIDEFYTETTATTGFYSIEKDDASGAYILSGNSYTATTGDLAVKTINDVTGFVGEIVTSTASGDYNLSEAVVCDTTGNGLDITSIAELKNEVSDPTTIDMCVVYDADTNVASYVYLTAYTAS